MHFGKVVQYNIKTTGGADMGMRENAGEKRGGGAMRRPESRNRRLKASPIGERARRVLDALRHKKNGGASGLPDAEDKTP